MAIVLASSRLQPLRVVTIRDGSWQGMALRIKPKVNPIATTVKGMSNGMQACTTS